MSTELTEQQPAASGLFCGHTPRAQLVRATAAILALPQISIVMRHYFADGVYGREGEVPKGAWLAGRVHHKAQINIISKGAVVVLTEDGVIEMRAPCTRVSPPGAQRSAFALEDTVWTTLIATDETDPGLIFETMTSPTFESFEVARNELQQIIEG